MIAIRLASHSVASLAMGDRALARLEPRRQIELKAERDRRGPI
jgi:hypothetical protein